MQEQESIILTRDCDAYLIPSGTRVSVPKDTEVKLTQALGDSFTVNVYGNLVRIDGKDADALDKDIPQEETFEVFDDGSVNEDALWAHLKNVYDPEIPVNIVELGLIYRCEVVKDEYKANKVEVDMTLTAPGCGMGGILAHDVERRLTTVPNVDHVHVNLVFDPPWDQSRMSDAAKLQLGMM